MVSIATLPPLTISTLLQKIPLKSLIKSLFLFSVNTLSNKIVVWLKSMILISNTCATLNISDLSASEQFEILTNVCIFPCAQQAFSP